MHSHIRPHSHIVLRLPSGSLKIVEAVPNTVVSISKFGSFPVNLLLGRPYFLTFEITNKQANGDDSSTSGDQGPTLRVVPASELNAEILSEDATADDGREDVAVNGTDAASFDIVADDGTVLMKNNRLTIDDASRQTLSMQEIEELKKAGTGSGRDIIERIMKSHTNLDEKTAFSLAKYTLRKSKKYLRRFTVLPMDVSMLTEFMLAEKEASRILELREEIIGLISSWANVHYGASEQPFTMEDGSKVGGGRWLVVDETGGLLVAAMAEKMGILYPEVDDDDDDDEEPARAPEPLEHAENGHSQQTDVDMDGDTKIAEAEEEQDAKDTKPQPNKDQRKQPQRHNTQLASSNTIHVVHANAQPNVSILKYFGYDTNNPDPTHPLHTHLKTLSWLQLLDPSADATYDEPEVVPSSELQTYKSGKRGAYYKKRRRWERCRKIVDEARAGGFDGLVVASVMSPAGILKHAVPLLRGAAHIVVFSPTPEPLTELMDLYSKDRKAAFLAHLARGDEAGPPPEEDFPLDPRLLLAPSLQTSKVRQWQVLPGRTHPQMTGRGGAEGYVFTARKVLPVEGRVEARGKYAKKRKVEDR